MTTAQMILDYGTALPAVGSLLDRRVMRLVPERKVAALCVAPNSEYRAMPGVECYDMARDVRTFAGGMPVVAHPPCRTWSAYTAHQAKALAQLCKAHGVTLSTSGYDGLQVWDADAMSGPIHCAGIEDCMKPNVRGKLEPTA